jgi:hypothetical protein
MTKEVSKHSKSGELESAPPPDRLASPNSLLSDAVVKSTGACLDGMSALNGEVVEFVNERVRRDIDLGQSLARCSNWAEACSLQQDWARQAMQDYIGETTKLFQLASKLTMASMDPVLRTASSMTEMVKPGPEMKRD